MQESLGSTAHMVEELMKPGTRVEVRTRFEGAWTRGFEIAEVIDDGCRYRIRRLSDGDVLPTDFSPDEIRKERRKQGLWWY